MDSLVNYEKRRLPFPPTLRTQARFSHIEFHFLPARPRGSLIEAKLQRMITQNLAYFASGTWPAIGSTKAAE